MSTPWPANVTRILMGYAYEVDDMYLVRWYQAPGGRVMFDLWPIPLFRTPHEASAIN